MADLRAKLEVALEIAKSQLDPEHIAHNRVNWQSVVDDFSQALYDTCQECSGRGAILVNPPNDCDFVKCPHCQGTGEAA